MDLTHPYAMLVYLVAVGWVFGLLAMAYSLATRPKKHRRR